MGIVVEGLSKFSQNGIYPLTILTIMTIGMRCESLKLSVLVCLEYWLQGVEFNQSVKRAFLDDANGSVEIF